MLFDIGSTRRETRTENLDKSTWKSQAKQQALYFTPAGHLSSVSSERSIYLFFPAQYTQHVENPCNSNLNVLALLRAYLKIIQSHMGRAPSV